MEKTFAVALGFIVLAALYLVKTRANSPKYPPGPRGWPLIGNLLDIPTTEDWVKYKAWSQEFKSDIIHLNACGMHIVVLNSLESISDLLEKRSAIYSSRPETPMLNLMGWGWLLLLMPNNDKWKAQRRLFRQEFDGGAIKGHYASIIDANNDMLQRFLEKPGEWKDHFRHMVGATIIGVTYGIKVLPVDDPYIKTAEAAVASAGLAVIPGAFMVDIFPILKYVPAWMPGAGFKTKAKEWKKDTDALFEVPFLAVKAGMADGTSRPSFCVHSLQDAEGAKDLKSEEYHIQSAAAGMYIAATDTTLTFLETFILAMVLHPEAQKKAQAEIDSLLGSERLPTFADQEHLPYLSALVKEVWRWQVGLPMAIAHQLAADDEYKGYFIPKGTIVMANSWQVMNDEVAYPEPSLFKPERFLKDGKVNPSVKNPTFAAFGYGRRACPGRTLAEHVVWLSAACILTLFDLSKAVDHNGKVIEPSGRYTCGVSRRPEEFPCQIKPRSSVGRDLIQSLTNF